MDFFLLSFPVVSVQPEDKISFQELNYLLWAYTTFFVARTQKIAKTRDQYNKNFLYAQMLLKRGDLSYK